MSLPDPRILHEAYGRELAELLERVLAGDLVADRTAAEGRVRSLGRWCGCRSATGSMRTAGAQPRDQHPTSTTNDLDARIEWIGADARGVELEIIVVEPPDL